MSRTAVEQRRRGIALPGVTHDASPESAPLRQITFLAVLPEAELAELVARMRSRRYQAGVAIFHRDDAGAALYIIHTGHVKLVLASPEGREITVRVLGPGDFFGEMALLDDGPRSASALALEPVEAMTLDRATFAAMLARHPAIASAFLAVLGAHLRRTDELIQDILFLDLPARRAKQLLTLAAHHGCATPRGVRIGLHLNQSELAAMIGAARESVNRCLNAYADRGIIAIERDAIIILKPEALQERIY
jgi:CRP-like cAMP-binding protein